MFKKAQNRKIFAAIVAIFCLIPVLFGCAQKELPPINQEDPMVVQFATLDGSFKEPKNIILMIGDGMGPNQVKVSTELTGGNYEGKAYMQYLANQGFARTESLDGVTDSAAAGTALATGFKTTNGTLGKDKGGHDLKNLVELAMEKGMRTGVITTKSATDATPAAFSSHVATRGEQERIALQQLQNLPNVLIGSGLEYYDAAKKAKKNLQEELDKKGISHLTTLDELQLANTDGEYLLCTTPYYMDLELATKKSLDLLEKDDDKGFFLMIEGGLIDSYCHANEMYNAEVEFLRFDRCVGMVMEFMIDHPDTLLIVTADHETGDLQYVEGGSPIYKFGSGNHSATNVPIFASGAGTEIFNDKAVENVDIAKFLAKKMGEKNFGQ